MLQEANSSQRRMRLAIIVVAVFAALVLLLADRVPPVAMTRSLIDVTEQRIRDYAGTYHRLPAVLSDLPKLQANRNSELTDGWGRLLRYTVTGQTVTLLSLGEDGRPGGDGEDADIEVTFSVVEPPSQAVTQTSACQ